MAPTKPVTGITGGGRTASAIPAAMPVASAPAGLGISSPVVLAAQCVRAPTSTEPRTAADFRRAAAARFASMRPPLVCHADIELWG